MWGIVAALAKEAFGFLFSTPKMAKGTIIVAVIVSIGAGTWYITNTYASMKADKAALEASVISLNTAIIILNEQAVQAQKDISDQRIVYELAIKNQEALQGLIIQIQADATVAQNVFTKEQNRYQKLLNAKGSRIVGLSNRASQRMRDKWTREAGSLQDSLQTETGSVPSTPSN